MLTADREIDRRILLQADSLEAAGWEVTVLAMPLDREDLQDDARVVRIDAGGGAAARENLVLGMYRWIRRFIPMNGLAMRALKRLAWRYLVDQEAFFVRLFATAASRFSPDVFVAHDLPMLAIARHHANRCGAKVVYDSHELYSEQEFSAREKARWAQIEARHIGACDAVITVNASIAAELEKRYGVRDVGVIYNADRAAAPVARTKMFHELYSLPGSTRVLLFQGGLSAGRNLETLVAAMRYVRDPSIVLVVLGAGALSKPLAALIGKHGLDGRVFIHAAVPQGQLLQMTAAADGGVIPYQATCLNNYLCTPNKLFEFIAAGLPILASDLPEIRKMVSGRDLGLVGDMRTPESTARLIDEFFRDDARLAAWARNSSDARKQVCWEVEGRKLVAIYGALQ